MSIKQLSNKQKANLDRKNFSAWKKAALNEKGFFIIFNGFVDTHILSKIGGGALKLYVFLGIKSDNNTGESFYTIEQIADYFSASQRTITNWFAELEKLNLISRYQLEFNGVAHTFLNTYNTGEDRGKKKKESI